jgi:hypothetical protein
MVVFHWAFSLNMQNWQFSRTGFAHFGATPASDRFDRERAARGIDFDAVGKARMIENRAKIDPHSLRERHSTFFMKRRKVFQKMSGGISADTVSAPARKAFG